MISGFDTSRYEMVSSWASAIFAGYYFCATRCTVGDYYTDPTFTPYMQGMKAAGIIRGAYHVYCPEKPIQAQIDRFFAALNGDFGEMPLILDVELSRGMTNTAIVDGLYRSCRMITTRTGRKPMIYTSQGFADEWLTPTPTWLNGYDLWVANYTSNAQPKMPKGWYKWTFWQYNDRSSVPGVQEACDVDYFNGTVEQLYQYCSLPVPPAPPQNSVIDQINLRLARIEERLNKLEGG